MRTLALVALLAVPLLLPLAAGDHVYSHRYVVEGRLVGNDGSPLPGRGVEFLARNVSFIETCFDSPHRSITDERGDFAFCFHTHDLPANGQIGARSGNASLLVLVDAALRRTALLLKDADETGARPEDWNETYRVGGRVWRAAAGELEGVRVHGLAIPRVPVNLTIHTADGEAARFTTETDAYGDFDLMVTTPADPSAITLVVEALGHGQPVTLDPEFHRTSVALYVPAEGAARPSGLAQRPQVAPGSADPDVSPALVLAVGAGLALSIGSARRKRV